MKLIQSVVTVIVILAIAAIAYAYSGIFNVAATEQHGSVSGWLLKTTRNKSIEARSGSIQVPDLSDSDLRLAGINDFDSMCAQCHTAPGSHPPPLARGLNPPALDLAEEVLEEAEGHGHHGH